MQIIAVDGHVEIRGDGSCAALTIPEAVRLARKCFKCGQVIGDPDLLIAIETAKRTTADARRKRIEELEAELKALKEIG